MVHSTKDAGKGRLSHTEYEVTKENSRYSLLKINLLAGNKNQIRVHLADEGHPIVGDVKYGRKDKSFPRMALHAQSLAFSHPITGEPIRIETELPQFFHSLIGS
ncbi:MAG TPA: hypothetical protein PK821_07950 [Victivallales bacterium]|nr:hypothetical protein [Victivallales bacterium]